MNQDDAKKQAFHNEMINLYKRTSKELKYKSTKLLDMINKYGGYEAAIKFITSESNKFDFTILWENERLDLSVEGLITNIKYRELFPSDVVSFCDKKLKEYNFSPKKIIEEKPIQIEDALTEAFMELDDIGSLNIPAVNTQKYPMYNRPIEISINKWKQLLTSPTVFTDKNKDLVLRIYLIGGYVEIEEIAAEEGYTAKYPYKEVVMALAKRIKAKVKLEVPKSRKGELLWWHLVFLGGFKDSTEFKWGVRPELRKAIDELIEEGKVDVSGIAIKSHKDLGEVPSELLEINEIFNVEVNTSETVSLAEKDELLQESKKKSNIEEISMKESVDEHIDRAREPKVTETLIEKNIDQIATKVEPKKEVSSLDSFIDSLLDDDFFASRTKEVKETKKVEEKIIEKSVAIPVAKAEQTIETIVTNKEASDDEKKQQEIVVLPKEKKQIQNETTYETFKTRCIEYYGAICEICGFDYGYTYGEAFENKIGIHHIEGKEEKELSLDTDPIQELVPICHNCHDIIHSKIPAYTLEQMRDLLKNAH